MAEERKQRRYSYRAAAAKGADFLSNPRWNRTEEVVAGEQGLRKPDASNKSIIMLDTGSAYVPGKCYDHHQLSQAAKLLYPSATSMVYKSRAEIYELHKNDENIEFICHEFPDNDAILSIALASIIMDYEGKTPMIAKELVEWANKADTFNYDLGYNFGSFLDHYINEFSPNRGNSNPVNQREAVEKAVNLVRDIHDCYCEMRNRETDPAKKEQINLNTVVNTIAKQDNEYFNYIYQRNFLGKNGNRTIRTMPKDLKKKMNQDAELVPKTFKDMINRSKTTIKNADENRNKFVGFGNNTSLGYDTFTVNLCKRQITKEQQQNEFEKSDKPCTVFVYTGSKPCPTDIALMAKKNYDAVIIPNYKGKDDGPKTTVTYKISTSRDDLDLAHFGRYIETMIYREKLNEKDSKLSSKEFAEEKRRFIESQRPLNEGSSKKHFTSYDSICGNDPTFFGFTVNDKSKMFDIQTVKEYMTDYFENPQKIKKDSFINIIGEENFEDMQRYHRPELFVPNEVTAIADTELDEITTAIVDANLPKAEEDKLINTLVDNTIANSKAELKSSEVELG